jgi:hypothetical protein
VSAAFELGTAMALELDAQVLAALGAGPVADTWAWAAAAGVDHQAVVGAVKSLEGEGYVVTAPLTTEFWKLTPEAEGYVAGGSPEAQLFAAVPEGDGLDDAGLDAAFPGRKEIVAIGKGKAMQKKWIVKDKATGKYRRSVSAHDAAMTAAGGHGSRTWRGKPASSF